MPKSKKDKKKGYQASRLPSMKILSKSNLVKSYDYAAAKSLQQEAHEKYTERLGSKKIQRQLMFKEFSEKPAEKTMKDLYAIMGLSKKQQQLVNENLITAVGPWKTPQKALKKGQDLSKIRPGNLPIKGKYKVFLALDKSLSLSEREKHEVLLALGFEKIKESM